MNRLAGICLALLGLLSTYASLQGREVDPVWTDEQLFPEPLLDLTDGWATPQGKRVQFPWRAEGLAEQAFHKIVFPSDSLLNGVEGDTLYIWMEGVAWESELVVDGQYWGVKKTAGQAWWVGIPRSQWQARRLEIILTLRVSQPDPFSPPPALWVRPPICLLTRQQLTAYLREDLRRVPAADSIAIVPAYYREFGWDFDGLEALRTLQPVLDLGIRHVYFPFPADRRLKKLCAFYGLTSVTALPPNATVMWTSAYPMAPGMCPIPEAYWLDETAFRTSYYGVWLSLERLVQIPGEPEGRESIVLVVLGILVWLLFLRLFFPGMFEVQMGWLWPARWTTEAIGDLGAGLPGPLWLWIASRWLLWAMVVTLATLMLRDQGLWLSIRPESTPGVAWQLLSEGNSLGGLMLRSLLLQLILDVIRYGIAGGASLAFGVPRFARAVLRLDMLATFPMVYVLGLPWAAAMLYPEYGAWGTWLGGGLFVIHQLRLMLATSAGLNQFYSFSAGAIFLYICTLKVLPYMVLW